MTPYLHDILEEAADLSGRVDFDSDALWRQANRSKRRHGALTGIAVAAALSLILMTVWWGQGLSRGSIPTPAADPIPTMPTYLRPVSPSPFPKPPPSRLDVGPVAALMFTQRDLVVAVSADDGRYLRLKLPGFYGGQTAGTTFFDLPPDLAISPDGTLLAYAWHAPLPRVSGPHVASGIRILDTVSGHVTTYLVPGGAGALCGAISWSASQQFLVYSCYIQSTLSEDGTDFQGVRLERLDVASGERITPPLGQVVPARAAVADDGSVAVASPGTVAVWSPGTSPAVEQTDIDVMSHVVFVGWARSDQLVVAGSAPHGPVYQRVSRPDGSGGAGPGAAAGPLHRLPGHADEDLRVVGTVTPGTVALFEYRFFRETALYTWSPGGGLARRVTVDMGTTTPPTDHYSFATDLLRPPSDGSAASSPTSGGGASTTGTWILWVLVVVVGAAGVLVIAWWLRRRQVLTEVR